MSVKSEEIKVVISASAGELKRELTAAEREMMKARGVMEQEGGKIAASSKVWSQYRSKTASELQKTLGEVERTQAKIDKLLEKGPAIRESEMSAHEAKLTAKGYSGETAARMTTEAAKRGDQLQGLQSVLAAQQASVQELYRAVAKDVETRIVGTQTWDGITIRGYKTHFIDRVIGSYEQRREGVAVEAVLDALWNGIPVDTIRPSGERSHCYKTGQCAVTVNPDTGYLIQTNPIKRRK